MPAWRGFGPVVMAGLAAYALVAGLMPGRRGAVQATRRAAERSPTQRAQADSPKPDVAEARLEGWRGWHALLVRVFSAISNDNIGMIAASVAFYALMAIASVISALILLALWPVVADYLPIARGTKILGSWLRWPFLAMLVLATLTFVYRFGPSRRVPCWHLFSWGSIAATALWLLAS